MATLIRSPKMSENSRVVSAAKAPGFSSSLDEPVLADSSSDLHSDKSASVPEKVVAKTEVVPDYKKLKADYQEVLARAEAAESRLNEIENQLDACRLENREAGYNAGYTKGEEEGREYYISKAKELEMLFSSISNNRHLITSEQEDNIVDVIYAAIVKIIGNVFITKDGVKTVICEVIKQVSFRDKLIIHVAPADFALLSEYKESIASETDSSSIDFVSDSRVQMGGCILESSSGSLDGRLEVQLQALKNTLLAVREDHAKENGEVAL